MRPGRCLIGGVLTVCFFYGCVGISEIKLLEGQRQIVVNGIFSPDSIWKVHVAFSGAVTGDQDQDRQLFLPPVTNAEVVITDGAGQQLALEHVGAGNYRAGVYPEAGMTYRLLVTVPGLDPISAESYIPQMADSLSAQWDLSQAVRKSDDWGGVFNTFRMSIAFQDPPDEPNFYRLGLVYLDSCLCTVSGQFTFSGQDTLVVDPLRGRLKPWFFEPSELPEASLQAPGNILLTDESFEGQYRSWDIFSADTSYLFYNSLQLPLTMLSGTNRYVLDLSAKVDSAFLAAGGRGSTQRLFLKVFSDVWSCSEELYAYQLTYYTQGNNTADPFSTFNNVYSNIEGGLGIFAGYQRRLLEVYSD